MLPYNNDYFYYNPITNRERILSKLRKKNISYTNLRNVKYFENKVLCSTFSDKAINSIQSISNSIHSYNKKNKKSVSLFNIYKQNYGDFYKFYNRLKMQDSKKEEEINLLYDLVNDYRVKKKYDINLKKITNKNIFKSSLLNESKIKRLQFNFLVHHDEIVKKAKENIENNKILITTKNKNITNYDLKKKKRKKKKKNSNMENSDENEKENNKY